MRIRTPTDLGLVIRERRRALGLDQRTLAEHAAVSRQWIVAVERGKARAEVGLLLRVLGVLGIRLDASAENPAPAPPGRKPAAGRAALDVDLDALLDRARSRKP